MQQAGQLGRLFFVSASLVALSAAAPTTGAAADRARAAAVAKPSPDDRAAALTRQLTLAEKIALVHTHFGTALHGKPAPVGSRASAGFGPGVPRLGIPPLQETDGGLGIADPTLKGLNATAMPSGLAVAASFDPALAEAAGAAIGAEARAFGFDVLLGGGADLIREPRGGRNFEYASEDPMLTGTIVGSAVHGEQRAGVVATLKHFALNSQENGRVLYDAKLGHAAAREADLFAFELALERSGAGAVMTAYNSANGHYTSENTWLITDTLKGDWRFPGWVMSDWGGTHSTVAAAHAGLDQESGIENDAAVFFGDPLAAAVGDGTVPACRLDDMVRRILRSRIVAGQIGPTSAPTTPPPPTGLTDAMRTAHAALAERVAARGIVLLKNDGVLPLRRSGRILVVGAHADRGVLSGGGSSQVEPAGSMRFEGEPPGLFYGKPRLFDPSSPLAALRAALPDATVSFDAGDNPAEAASAARQSDVTLVFADQWSNESQDQPDLSLPGKQDALIAAVAKAAPRTVVVLETGNPVTMPWLSDVAGVLEAWYPGERGGAAIAAVLTGAVDASGRLPVSFPRSTADLPRPKLPQRSATTSNPDEPIRGGPFTVDYDIEGADVGYKWYIRNGTTPLFPFGYGLSYTRFAIADLAATKVAGGTLAVRFSVRNIGTRAGIAVPQLYLEGPGFTRRLVGFTAATLAPGQGKIVTLRPDPRLFATFVESTDDWHRAAGRYTLSLRTDALAPGPTVTIKLPVRTWSARHAVPAVGSAERRAWPGVLNAGCGNTAGRPAGQRRAGLGR